MSLKSNVTVHAVLWVIWFWLGFVVLASTGWQGAWYNRKYLYNLVPSVPFLGIDGWKGNLFEGHAFDIEGAFKKAEDYSKDKPWPSGRNMSLFKFKLGCFGNNTAIKTLLDGTTDLTHAQMAMMTSQQKMYNEGDNSVCTCIDKLYYASLQNYTRHPADANVPLVKEATSQMLAPELRTLMQDTMTSNAFSELLAWMAESTDTEDERYDGVAFTNVMVNAKSSDLYITCEYYDAKKILTDKHKCIVRRDLEILSVCSKSAQNSYLIEFRGIVNSSFVTTYGVLCIFWYMFVTIYRHMHSTKSYVKKVFVYTTMLGNGCLMCVYFFGMNWGLVVNWWWTDPWYGDLHRGVVFFASLLGVLDVLVVLIVAVSGMFKKGVYAEKLPSGSTNFQKVAREYSDWYHTNTLLSEKPARQSDLIITQMINDVPLIVGFSILFNGLLMETGVNETHSLGIVVVMGMTLGFTQHLSNILHETSLRHLNKEDEDNLSTVQVSGDHYRLVNEIAAHRVYILVVTVFICVYLVISPRESMPWTGQVLYILSVLVCFFAFTAFDVIREADKILGNGKSAMWVSVSDKEKIKSVILLLFVLGLMVSSGASMATESVALER
jgi:hypothetical protein